MRSKVTAGDILAEIRRLRESTETQFRAQRESAETQFRAQRESAETQFHEVRTSIADLRRSNEESFAGVHQRIDTLVDSIADLRSDLAAHVRDGHGSGPA